MGKKKQRPLPQELNLPAGGADSHVHLDMGHLSHTLDQVLARAGSCGVSTLGHVFLGPESYRRGEKNFSGYDQVFFILGVHPHDARNFSRDDASDIIEHAGKDKKIRAVGEIGLDFFYEHSLPQEQIQAFRTQLDSARQMSMPVVIHSRDAYPETVSILMDMGLKDYPVLWHCFGQGPEQAREIISLGWHISIPGSVTYKKNTMLREAVKTIDPDRLLLETDCPFLAPEPYRGKENEPALLGFTALQVAQIKNMRAEELWIQCGANCRRFFNIADTLPWH